MQRQRGVVFMIMLVIMVMGLVAFFVSSLGSSALQLKRDEVTGQALAQAKEALIGYAVTYGDVHSGQMYGYLPLPDLGSTRNGTPEEGNASGTFVGNTKNLTVIGRLPWRKLGLLPLRDSQGECLWYAVSGSFQNVQQADVLNWDSLGHFDIYSSNGTSPGTVSTTGANYAKRPVAIIFSAGAVLQGQNRQKSTTILDTVDTCGGNYNARNYLDSFNPDTNINNIVNYFTDPPNNSTGYAYSLAAASDGSQLSAAALTTPKNIISGDIEVNIAGSPVKIANDRILTITTDDIFRPIIRRSDFRDQIRYLLDDADLRLQVETGHVLTTVAVSGIGTKGADNVDCNAIGNAANKKFCLNWKEMLLLTEFTLPSSIKIDSVINPSCKRVLIFSGQKFGSQVRDSTTDKSNPANYLEGQNLAAFATPIANNNNFSGWYTFDMNNPSADLMRCLP
jgi:type II secretory pathway pseudopilin PulG